MELGPLDLEIRRIVTDNDLDGVVTASILRRWWTEAEVIFGHPGELRAGFFDGVIDRWTAICDLPFHKDCGLCIDHHQSNKPDGSTSGKAIEVWRDSPSAARIAFELVGERLDLSDLEELIEWVDKLDGGGITKEEYLSDESVLWLSRVIDSAEDTAMWILEAIQGGLSLEMIMSDSEISNLVDEERTSRDMLINAINENFSIVDRLAIVRLEGLGVRSNGYQITAMAGDDCDACVVIHGDVGATFGEDGRYPVSASFYTNSFLHQTGGVFDLTSLATFFDTDGGGHANACGCRIKPIKGGVVEDREVSENDVERNISAWLEIWSGRLK